MISCNWQKVFTASKYLHGDSLWKCVTLDTRSFMNTEIAQWPILPFAALSIKTTTLTASLINSRLVYFGSPPNASAETYALRRSTNQRLSSRNRYVSLLQIRTV